MAQDRWLSCLGIMLLYIPVAIVAEHVMGVQLEGWDVLSDLGTTAPAHLWVLAVIAAVRG